MRLGKPVTAMANMASQIIPRATTKREIFFVCGWLDAISDMLVNAFGPLVRPFGRQRVQTICQGGDLSAPLVVQGRYATAGAQRTGPILHKNGETLVL